MDLVGKSSRLCPNCKSYNLLSTDIFESMICGRVGAAAPTFAARRKNSGNLSDEYPTAVRAVGAYIGVFHSVRRGAYRGSE